MDAEIFTIDKNKREQLRVRLRKYNGFDLLDARIFEQDDKQQRMVPSKRGWAIRVGLVDELIDGLEQARGELKRGGLI